MIALNLKITKKNKFLINDENFKHIIPLKIWLISFVSMYVGVFLFGLVADYEIKKYKKRYVFYLIKITQFSIMGALGLAILPAWAISMMGFFTYLFDLFGGG